MTARLHTSGIALADGYVDIEVTKARKHWIIKKRTYDRDGEPVLSSTWRAVGDPAAVLVRVAALKDRLRRCATLAQANRINQLPDVE